MVVGCGFVTPLTELLGIAHPILLAPMGDAAGGRLAGAVSDAGGFGLIGGGYADPVWLERELELARGHRVGVGFITFALERRPDTLDLALDAGPVAVQLSFGDPRPFVDRIRAAGALLVCQVQSDEEVAAAVEVGADVIVAQGQDAGGHGRPARGTMGLIPSVVDRVAPIPVVAAGGIADGRGLAAALALGAAGVAMGTRFLATVEAISTPHEAEALTTGRTSETVRTPVFDEIRGPAWPDGHDGRVVANRFVSLARTEDPETLRRLYADSDENDLSIRPVWAGEGLDLIPTIEPAGAVVARVVSEARIALEAAVGSIGRVGDGCDII